MYLNKVYLVGNLTRDPELKTLPSGIKVANFSLATNRVWYDTNKQKQEAVEYHNVVVFGRQAETSAQFLTRGAQAMVEGRLQTRSWDDPSTGKKNYRTEIIAERVQFGSRSQGGAPALAAPSTQSSAPQDSFDQQTPDFDAIDYPEEDINPEDIPF
jgi:single-strand DNA-binding protein